MPANSRPRAAVSLDLSMKKIAKAMLAKGGWELGRSADREAQALADLSPADRQIVARVAPYTMTGLERRASLLCAVDHVVRHRIPGDVVECGVWRGGSMMAVALALMARGDTSRDLWLFDTFEGMSAPTDADRGPSGESAQAQLERSPRDAAVWAVATLDDVRTNLAATGYPAERIHCVPGKVEDTLPGAAPERIALLRLDTDWYESTRHELEHLYARVSPGGVVLFDDYGYWEGARQAVDEFLARTGERLLLAPMGSGRIAVKP
jgi:O-methyltransferase